MLKHKTFVFIQKYNMKMEVLQKEVILKSFDWFYFVDYPILN